VVEEASSECHARWGRIQYPKFSNSRWQLGWWECKLVQPLWKKIWRLLKNLNIDLPYDPAIPLLGI
jgi:hypothetical protein